MNDFAMILAFLLLLFPNNVETFVIRNFIPHSGDMKLFKNFYSRSRNSNLKMKKNFDLEDVIILSQYKIDQTEVRGVYVVENNNGEIQYVGHSFVNIFDDIEYYKKKFQGSNKVFSLRVKSFPASSSANAIIDYKNELLLQVNDAQVLNSSEWIIPSPSNEDAKEILANKIKNLKSQDSNTNNNQKVILETKESPMKDYKVITIEDEPEVLDLNVNNVDIVLNEVRPYLIADGGNIRVVSVDADTGIIRLELQGACGSCPSSTTTMKMGVERVLREKFPFLKSVESVTPLSAAEPEKILITKEFIEDALKSVMPAISSMGGTLVIESIDNDMHKVVLGFKGPPRLKQGIKLILKEVKALEIIEFNDII